MKLRPNFVLEMNQMCWFRKFTKSMESLPASEFFGVDARMPSIFQDFLAADTGAQKCWALDCSWKSDKDTTQKLIQKRVSGLSKIEIERGEGKSAFFCCCNFIFLNLQQFYHFWILHNFNKRKIWISNYVNSSPFEIEYLRVTSTLSRHKFTKTLISSRVYGLLGFRMRAVRIIYEA